MGNPTRWRSRPHAWARSHDTLCQPSSHGHDPLSDARAPAQHTRLIKCADDANTYLVNDISDPLQRSLTSLHLTDVLLGAPPPGASSTYAPVSSELTPRPQSRLCS